MRYASCLGRYVAPIVTDASPAPSASKKRFTLSRNGIMSRSTLSLAGKRVHHSGPLNSFAIRLPSLTSADRRPSAPIRLRPRARLAPPFPAPAVARIEQDRGDEGRLSFGVRVPVLAELF